MKKFFKYLYNILNNKAFRVFFIVFVLFCMFYYHFKSNFNKNKFVDTVELIKENKKKENFEKQNINSKKIVVKKEIITDKNDNINTEKTTLKDTKIKKITNILLKIKEIEAIYSYKLKNNKIENNRVIKEGDYIYYSMKTIFNNEFNSPNSPEMRLFMSVDKNNDFSKKLIGKKINEKIFLNYKDIVSSTTERNKKEIEKAINSNFSMMNKKYGKGKDIFKNNDIVYELVVLDFIQDNLIKELQLEKE